MSIALVLVELSIHWSRQRTTSNQQHYSIRFGFHFVIYLLAFLFRRSHSSLVPSAPSAYLCTTNYTLLLFALFLCFRTGLLRLQQIYQGLRPGNETFQVETVKRITNATNAIEFLKTLEDLNRWSKKYIVLDCPTDMAKDIVVYHVRNLSLGRRTYHYLLSSLVSLNKWRKVFTRFFFRFFFPLIHVVHTA